MIIGGGILGLSTAWQLQQRYPDAAILVLEKETALATHQTGRNSGVIHAGVYYTPGSLKARFCKQGNAETKAFCREHGIPFDECGKLLVATTEDELVRMQALIQRCEENEIPIEVLDQAALAAREPNITGLGAIFVPSTGIVDYQQITNTLAQLFTQAGGTVQYGRRVVRLEQFHDRVTAYCGDERYQARYMVACAGLHADRLVWMLGYEPDFRIIPFRGEYYRLAPEHNQIVNHLIYPIPNPDLPFLGVHLTRMIDGSVTVGPNAVLALHREGYEKGMFSLSEAFRILTYRGTFRLVLKNFRASLVELKNSLSKRGYLGLVHKYCPQLTVDDLQPYPSGIRAQAVRKDGTAVDDFLFTETARALVVCNAPSPAATSALPIGRHIIERLEKMIE
ncbi:L-2-hydroxyglutarate oxidase [Neptuniibacter sp. CAU 1671]|uniref:L-2-hydroxyglutarate oxidase n=1 Tax=Neptuniibacter sp. CAU 1671 TaxID=3032593 RepID=UPI0023DB3CD4|nr:L-2-hydroxyglutarate oxidase [Neptuniibacter sp. CAU 1671]MDF2183158.1 L-2-hydroxyglutarate oxidase [Neptuniibacter sp. CAU 1671]